MVTLAVNFWGLYISSSAIDIYHRSSTFPRIFRSRVLRTNFPDPSHLVSIFQVEYGFFWKLRRVSSRGPRSSARRPLQGELYWNGTQYVVSFVISSAYQTRCVAKYRHSTGRISFKITNDKMVGFIMSSFFWFLRPIQRASYWQVIVLHPHFCFSFSSPSTHLILKR